MNETLHNIDTCEVCGNTELISVLDLGLHPMCDDLVPIGDKRVCAEYPIEILFCDCCCTAHQRFQVPKRELFPSTYHYRSRFTADVLSGMAGLVASCEQRFGRVAGKTVLDIGCNDGSLLDIFREHGAVTIGVEPTKACLDAEQKGHVTYNGFLSEQLAERMAAAHGTIDIITFTNVFAHIEDLPEVIRALKRLMGATSVLVIENHYLGSVLAGNQFDTFYHEHPRTYSYTSFVHIARSLGTTLSAVEFPARYGGNIRVFLGSEGTSPTIRELDLNALAEKERGFRKAFVVLRENVQRWRETKKRVIEEQVATDGKLRAKAFPGRAAILAKLLGLDRDSISAVYEKPGSLKIGHYVPGTRIEILSDDDLFSLPEQTKPLLNLAWHIPGEIRGYVVQHGYMGKVIDVLSPEDFSASA